MLHDCLRNALGCLDRPLAGGLCGFTQHVLLNDGREVFIRLGLRRDRITYNWQLGEHHRAIGVNTCRKSSCGIGCE